MLIVACQSTWGPKQDRHCWAEEVVWPMALPEETSLANLSLVTQSGKLAPVGFGKEAFMSSAGENAECPWFREGKRSAAQDHSWAITQKGFGREPGLPLFLTCMVLHPNWSQAHPWHMRTLNSENELCEAHYSNVVQGPPTSASPGGSS